MKDYKLNLEQFKLYPQAEEIFGRLVRELIPDSIYDKERRAVYHDRPIDKEKQEIIKAYNRALQAADVGGSITKTRT